MVIPSAAENSCWICQFYYSHLIVIGIFISFNDFFLLSFVLQVRGVEVGIVVVVLLVWAGAIALFFNRWGKIRMLLPYQPDYKQEQLKVPGRIVIPSFYSYIMRLTRVQFNILRNYFSTSGTGVCSAGTCNGQHSHQVNTKIY